MSRGFSRFHRLISFTQSRKYFEKGWKKNTVAPNDYAKMHTPAAKMESRTEIPAGARNLKVKESPQCDNAF